MSGKHYVREQKHICGKDYATAQYMEVDVFEIIEAQHKASARAKKELATSLVKDKYNEEARRRYLGQLIATNFGPGDWSITQTYNDENLPAAGDLERADKDFSNFIKRLYRYCDKRGIEHPKWLCVTEYQTLDEAGKPLGRHHHHVIMSRQEGLTRETLESLWGKGRTRCEPLEFEHGNAEGLAKYITKNRRCKRNWRQSRGLESPKTPRPNDSRWSRKKLEDAFKNCLEDGAFWEKKFPGYRLHRCESNLTGSGTMHLVVKMYRDDRPRKRRNRP